jgi:hypothetical protein
VIRCFLVALLLSLAVSVPARAQDDALFEAPRSTAVGGAAHDGGRSALLVGLGVLCLVAAAGTLVVAVRRPPPRSAPVDEAPREEWHPRPVSGPPPLPAFGPGAGSTAGSAPPPPGD